MSATRRIHSGSRLIAAPAEAIYRAFLDPEAVVRWRPPQGMTADIHRFEPWPGGRFRMTFRYGPSTAPGHGKTTADSDAFEGRFVELIVGERIVEEIVFDSDDPGFSAMMTVVTTFAPHDGRTEVTITVLDVPSGISEADHQAGIASTLNNLAAWIE